MNIADVKRLKLSDREVSSNFTRLVEGYANDLTKNKSKGTPGSASVVPQRHSTTKRNKKQLLPSEVFSTARLAIFKSGWAQGVLTTPDGKMCLRGAIVHLATKGYIHPEDQQRVGQYLQNEVRRMNGDSQMYNFIYWNNDPRRTLAQVLKLLEDCASRARVAGE
jgi:hypothetical protein